MMLAQSGANDIPPCRNGKATCKPWERAWSDPEYGKGPFNLILRWGEGAPIVIRYESRERCETAELIVDTQSQIMFQEVDDNGKPMKTYPTVNGPNAPWAFCIPA
jgi:hypothetical protein